MWYKYMSFSPKPLCRNLVQSVTECPWTRKGKHVKQLSFTLVLPMFVCVKSTVNHHSLIKYFLREKSVNKEIFWIGAVTRLWNSDTSSGREVMFPELLFRPMFLLPISLSLVCSQHIFISDLIQLFRYYLWLKRWEESNWS